jgi:hypothetical protein
LTVELYLSGIGLCAPGLPDWPTGRAVLTGQRPYRPDEPPRFDRVRLPANEKRRATLTVRLALQAAAAALADTGLDPRQCGAVFACSGGNTEALDALCRALTEPGRPVSPGQFNHSVHNAPLGYWAISTGSVQPAVSLGAYDASFAAGLIEAGALAGLERLPVLLVAYDTPPPPALQPFRVVVAPFAAVLLLTPEPRFAGAVRLSGLRIEAGATDAMTDPALERLRSSNPAARSLPLLQRLAAGQAGAMALPYLPDTRLAFSVEPCGSTRRGFKP